jgi:hypothetical protein
MGKGDKNQGENFSRPYFTLVGEKSSCREGGLGKMSGDFSVHPGLWWAETLWMQIQLGSSAQTLCLLVLRALFIYI